MATLILGAYLTLVGLVQTFSVPIPAWVMGILALIAGILLLLEASDHPIIVRKVL